MKPNKLKLLNDNDLAGIRFNATLTGSLRPPAKSIDGKVTFVANDQVNIHVDYLKPKNRMSIEIGHPEKTNAAVLLHNLTAYFKKLNKKLHNLFSFKKNEFEISKIVQNEGKTKAEVFFDNRKEMLLEAVKVVQELNPSKFIEIEMPKDKDFNKDLENLIKEQQQPKDQGMSI